MAAAVRSGGAMAIPEHPMSPARRGFVTNRLLAFEAIGRSNAFPLLARAALDIRRRMSRHFTALPPRCQSSFRRVVVTKEGSPHRGGCHATIVPGRISQPPCKAHY